MGSRVGTEVTTARLQLGQAECLRRAGHDRDALSLLVRTATASPTYEPALLALADAFARAGHGRASDSVLTLLEGFSSGRGLAFQCRGLRAAREGRLEEAERQFLAATKEFPDLWDAWSDLVKIELQLGHREDAAVSLGQAQLAGMPKVSLRAHQALLAAVNGDAAQARRELEQVPASAIKADPRIAEIVNAANGVLAGAR